MGIETSSRSKTGRMTEANAFMEEAVKEFTVEEMAWWNAILDEATSNEVAEIVIRLYESEAVDVGSSKSLKAITQHSCKHSVEALLASLGGYKIEEMKGKDGEDEDILSRSKCYREVKRSKCMTVFVWKCIISIGTIIVSIGKWISEVMLSERSLPISTKKKMALMFRRSGSPSIFLLMMLLAPPHCTYTLANNVQQFVRRTDAGQHMKWKGVRSLSQEGSFVEKKSALAAPDCAVLSFDWGIDNPYTNERQLDGEKPFTLTPGCEETQRCLFMPDHKIFNIIGAGDAVFPVTENVLSDRSPSVEQVLANAERLYEDRSIMNILGVGTYKGPAGIGEYRIIPQFLGDQGRVEVTKFVASPSTFSAEIEFISQEQWNHLNYTQTTTWNIGWSYYPCSIVRVREDLAFPLETDIAFSDSGKGNGTVDSVCRVVMEHCTGSMQQFDTTEECVAFLGSLPHHDEKCQDKFGEYSSMGSSFMCKYLHHFMIPYSPELHCAHVGKGLPDLDGNYKCVATDCQKEKATQVTGPIEPSCRERDAEELVQGIIYALPYCLPSLEMQVCLPTCTQAINTYLGRFAQSGVIDSCDSKDVLGSSRLLSSISVDAHVLFHLCSRDTLLAADIASSPLYSHSIPTCVGVNEYLGSGLRCLGWDWQEVSQRMYKEWSAKYKVQRITQSDDIATAECDVFTRLYTQYLNINGNQILDHASNSMQSDIQIHPNGNRLILSHEQVSMAFEQSQSRDGMGMTFGHCELPGKIPDWIQNKRFNPLGHDTNSTSHKLARQFVSSIMRGMTEKQIAPPVRKDLFDERRLLDYEELFLTLAEENFRALLGEIPSKSDSFWTGNVIDEIRDLTKAAAAWFFPESWHRAQGYISGAAYASLRATLSRRMKDELIPLQEEILPFLLLFNVSTSDEYLVYDTLIDALLAVPLPLVKLTRDIVKFIRQDPCQMLPLWKSSPERFVVEYTRLYAPVPGFATHSSTSKVGLRYQIASANRDPEVFLDPLSFDPERPDLDQVMSWNFIEGAGPSSHARSCPARSYAIQFVISHAKRYFPKDIACANDMKVHNGVELFEEYNDLADGSRLQLLKTSTGSNTLFLFLHGFPDVPQEFAPVISYLQSKLSADYWIVNGWSMSKCKITEYAEQVATLISEVKAQSQYDEVFLVGHDFGGLVGWVVADILGKDALSGFISFSPKPQVFATSLRMIPAGEVPFYNLMKPLAGSTYLATKDYQVLDDALTNETFWPEYRDEYHRMWDEVGPHALTCVYRENFDVIGGKFRLTDLEGNKEAGIETDLLLISGEDDMLYPQQLYHASIGAISPRRGQQLSHKEIHGASHHSMLHDHSKETAHHIEMFVRSVNRKQISLWSQMTIPPQVHSSYHEELTQDTTTFYVYILTLVVMLTGIIMELTIGPMLVGKLGFGVYLFAQVMAATITFGCYFAANLITLPIFTVGLFKLGYPEVTSHIIGPIRSPEFYFDNKFFRVISFISGIAYVIHHTGATILYMVVSLHEMNPLSLGFIALAVGFQHLVVFIKYRHKHLYSFLLIGLEIWFQLESYYALTFTTTSARVGIGMLLISHYIWLVHGVVQTSLEIFMRDSSDDKIDDDNSNVSETDGSKSLSGSVRSMRSSLHKQHSLRLYSSLHSIGEENDLSMGDDDTYTLPDTIEIDERSPTTSVPPRRRSLEGSLDKHGSLRLYQSSFKSINEEDNGENENEHEEKEQSKPTTDMTEPSLRARFQNSKTDGVASRRSMLQSRSSRLGLVSQKSRLFDSNEVMNLMGFDEESAK